MQKGKKGAYEHSRIRRREKEKENGVNSKVEENPKSIGFS
jgi:hypothetical protein